MHRAEVMGLAVILLYSSHSQALPSFRRLQYSTTSDGKLCRAWERDYNMTINFSNLVAMRLLLRHIFRPK